MTGQVPLITATVAFGMGVDKSSVRFVAHWSAPQSIGAYSQESGRAGRDGSQAFGRIYYSTKDRDSMLIHLNNQKYENNEKKTLLLENCKRMVKYCEGLTCRHSVLSDYFGDSKPKCVDKCDICIGIGEVRCKLDKLFNGEEDENDIYRNANIELCSVIKKKFYKKELIEFVLIFTKHW